MSEEITLTPAQRLSTERVDRDLLVSAAAGSGKTTVLVNRVLQLLGLRAGAEQRADLDRILVVTFTRKAARQMRSRIFREARNHPGSGADIAAQLERAWISTVHSFCSRVLRDNYAAAGLDPNFAILGQGESNLILRELITQLVEQRFDPDSGVDRSFSLLYRELSRVVKEERLAEQLISSYKWLRTLKDYRGFGGHQVNRDGALAKADNPDQLGTAAQALTAPLLEEVERIQRRVRQLATRVGEEVQKAPFEWEVWQRLYPEWIEPFTEFEVNDLSGYFELGRMWRRFKSSPFGQGGRGSEWSLGKGKPGNVSTPDALKRANNELKDLFRDGLHWLFDYEWGTLREEMEALVERESAFYELLYGLDESYREYKDKRNRLDQSDLVIRAHDLLSADEEVRRSYQHRFNHVLVDEYQDIDPLQHDLLEMLSRDATRFLVGDVKQSIYRFRHAEPDIFRDELDRADRVTGVGKGEAGEKELPAGELRVPLSDNFRSRKEVLDCVNFLMAPLFGSAAGGLDYPPEDRLRLGLDVYRERAEKLDRYPEERPAELMVTAVETEEDEPTPTSQDLIEYEAERVARRIEEMLDAPHEHPVWDDDAETVRELRAGDIVVLMRAVKGRAQPFLKALEQRGVPTHVSSAGDFFERPEVRDALNLLKVVDNPVNDIPLAGALRFPLWDLTPGELVKLQLNLPDRENYFYCMVDALERAGVDTTPLTQGVEVPDFLRGERKELFDFSPGDDLVERLTDFMEKLAEWRRAAERLELAELVGRVLSDSQILRFAAGYPEPEAARANLERLRQLAADFAETSGHSLHRFIRYLEDLRVRLDPRQLEEVLAVGERGEAVRIMSVHQAKGLEFPVVVLPDLLKQFNEGRLHKDVLLDREIGVTLRRFDADRGVRWDPLPREIAKRRQRRRDRREEMRLLYVAMTRAREQLILSVCGKRTDGRGASLKKLSRWLERWRELADLQSWPWDPGTDRADLPERERDRAGLFEHFLLDSRRVGNWVLPPLLLSAGVAGEFDEWRTADSGTGSDGATDSTSVAEAEDTLVRTGLTAGAGDYRFPLTLDCRTAEEPAEREPVEEVQDAVEAVKQGEEPELEAGEEITEIVENALARISAAGRAYPASGLEGLESKYTATELRRLAGDRETESRLATETSTPFEDRGAADLMVELDDLLARYHGDGETERAPPGGLELGNLYHAAMEHLDPGEFALDPEAELRSVLGDEGFVRAGGAELVERVETALAEDQVNNLYTGGWRLRREQTFTLRVDVSEFRDVEGYGGEPFVVVIGQLDLLALKDGEAFVIDWKTDGLAGGDPPDTTELRERYRPQLAVYRRAVRATLGTDTVTTALYSFAHGELIGVPTSPGGVAELLGAE